MELTIHEVDLKDFVKYLQIMEGTTEHFVGNEDNKNGRWFMAGNILFKGITIKVFSVSYDQPMKLVKSDADKPATDDLPF